MEIELRNIEIFERLSDETTAFAASIYIDGFRAGEAKNDGRGGSTFYQGSDERGRQLIREAEKYCKSLPPRVVKGADYGGDDFRIPMDLEGFIDDLLMNHMIAKDLTKFQRKMDNAMQSGIVVGVPDSEFRVWKLKIPIAQFMANDKFAQQLRRLIEDKVVPNLKAGEFILNTNFSVEFVMQLKGGAERMVLRGRRHGKEGSDEDSRDAGQRRKKGL
jgi:hypothetical protein